MRLYSSPPDHPAIESLTAGETHATPKDAHPARELHLRATVREAQRRLVSAEHAGDLPNIASALRELGAAEHELGHPERALNTLERADRLFASLPPSTEQSRNLAVLVAAYEATGRYQEALTVHKRFHALEMANNPRARDEWRRAEAAEAQLVRLRTELTYALRRQHELSEINNQLISMERQKTAQLQQAERFSLEDSVTQVNNRRCLDVRLAADVQRARRYESPLAIAMVDIDDFKFINDRLSHAHGDAVLRRVAAVMRESLRDSDYVARYGGDEFVLVFPETRLHNAQPVCEMIRAKIEAEPWEQIAKDLRVTVTIGVAERSASANSPDVLLNDADRMLYAAKHAGKNCVAPLADCPSLPGFTGRAPGAKAEL